MSDIYHSKHSRLPGKRYGDVKAEASRHFKLIQRRTKRRPYVRSAYFGKQKIFFDYFWLHLFQKVPTERKRRLRYFPAAVDLMQHTRHDPVTLQNPSVRSEILHRFTGKTKEGDIFYVQIKEDKRKDRKYFMSCFSAHKQ